MTTAPPPRPRHHDRSTDPVDHRRVVPRPDPRAEPIAAARGRDHLRPFHTPVRGHLFATRPAGGAALGRATLRLRREPDNPADPHAVAVWAEGGGRPWRVGYLERAVAVRVAGRLRAGVSPPVSFAGWWEEPRGRWHRPVVRVGGDADDRAGDRGPPRGLRSLPPCATRRTRRAVGGVVP